MTQFQHTLRQLLLGEKTETSRIALPEPDGTGEFDCEMITYPMGKPAVSRMKKDALAWRHVWITGKDYSIQRDRTSKSVGRYRVEAIWRQDVRTLIETQVHAEGFRTWQDFFRVWCEMHDKPALPFPTDLTIWRHLEQRPAERYTAWRMTIRVLWETVDWDAPAVRALQIEPKSVY